MNELPLLVVCCVLEYGRVTGEPGVDGPSGGAPVGPGQHTQVWRRPKSGLTQFGIGQNVLLTPYNMSSPLQVTIFGESAGSASVSHLILASDVTDGLFKGWAELCDLLLSTLTPRIIQIIFLLICFIPNCAAYDL